MNKLLAALGLVLILALPVHATVYCVDAAGSDANTGIAPSCWQSVTHACAQTFAAGDTIEFAEGQTFRATSTGAATVCAMASGGSSGSPLTLTQFVGSSGVGAKPIIDGADCEGAATGDCAAATAVTSWALCNDGLNKCPSSTSLIYYLPWTANVQAIYVDNAIAWPDNGGITGTDNPRLACGWSTCVTTSPATLGGYLTSHAYAANSCIQTNAYPGSYWCTTAGGTTGAAAPTWCTSGCLAAGGVGTATTVTDSGGVVWTYEGDSYSVNTAMGATAQAQWWQDGTNLYMKLNPADSPNNHVIEVSGHVRGFDADSANAQYITINGLEFRHGGEGVRFFNTSASVCPNHLILENSIITQTGCSNIDAGQFLNGLRVSGSDTSCTTATSTLNQFLNNTVSYTGDHGGNLTLQLDGGDLIQGNTLTHANHADVNLVGGCNGSSCPAQPSDQVLSNYIGDSVASQNGTSGVGGLYGNNVTGILIAKNIFANLNDPACTGGQCVAISLNNGGSGTIQNNTAYNMQYFYYTVVTSEGGAPGPLTIENNLIADIHAEAATPLPLGKFVSTELTGGVADYNVYSTGTTDIAQLNGTNYTWSGWQTAGNDTHGYNANALFFAASNPFYLLPGSVGINQALVSVGYGSNIGANQVAAGGFILP